jgi:hypothetical protein
VGQRLPCAVFFGFDWTKLSAKLLALDGNRLIQLFSRSSDAARGTMTGLIFGIAIATIAAILVKLRAPRRGAAPAFEIRSRWRNIVPDFSALIPATSRERLL